MTEGFVDLRQNQAQLVDESFWPSFTDIMTVVVMIFLIATSILIVKNWELVNELKTSIEVEQKISQRLKASIAAQQRTSEELLLTQDKRDKISQKLQLSIEAERRTAEAIQKTSIEKASLEETLAHAQSDMSLMRLQIMQAKESASERDRLIMEQDKHINQLTLTLSAKNKAISIKDQAISSKDQQIEAKNNSLLITRQQLTQAGLNATSLKNKLRASSIALEDKEQKLEEQLAALTLTQSQLEQLSSQNKTHLANIQNYEKQIDSIQEGSRKLTSQIEQQQDSLRDKDAQLALLNEQNQSYQENISDYEQQVLLAQQKRSALSSEYEVLEEKYNKLIKPSRSAVGKQVVEVRYEKQGDDTIIQFRKPTKGSNQQTYQSITEAQLHQKLLVLKQQYKKTLYVKIIIPDDSGLSYNEAWTFMMGILEKYDYYYQD